MNYANNRERIDYMDSMRATLMMLGVFVHSVQKYNYSDEPATIMMNVALFLHIFRMPAFFVVSGFFCHFTLQRYNTRKSIMQWNGWHGSTGVSPTGSFVSHPTLRNFYHHPSMLLTFNMFVASRRRDACAPMSVRISLFSIASRKIDFLARYCRFNFCVR